MSDILTQCRLKWARGEIRTPRKTPRLTLYPFVFNIETYETRGRAVITDIDGIDYTAEYRHYDDILHDFDLLRMNSIIENKKRVKKETVKNSDAISNPDGHSAV